jgi:hypothetical protein
MSTHRVRWFGVDPSVPFGHPEHLVPRNRHMNGRDWGWDVKCSCGWESRTGGAIEARVREAVEDHKSMAD